MRERIEIYLLDTHVFVWLMNGSEDLASSPCIRRLEEAASRAGIKVSAISIWEIGMLESKGRVSLPTSPAAWVERALTAPGLSLVPLTPAIALHSSRLPGNFHGDPADRIIVATARELGATLVTRDRQILDYGARHHVRTLQA